MQVLCTLKSSGMGAQKSRKGLKGKLMIASKKTTAQGQVENHNIYRRNEKRFHGHQHSSNCKYFANAQVKQGRHSSDAIFVICQLCSLI